jgi:hypothetical protein
MAKGSFYYAANIDLHSFETNIRLYTVAGFISN